MNFSSGDGFYVSNDLCSARERAARLFGENNSAVLVFSVRKVELRSESNDNGLDLRDIERKKGEWKKLVQNFLSGEPSRKFLKTMVAKGGYDFSGFLKPKNDS